MPKGQNKTKRKNCGGLRTPTPKTSSRSRSRSRSRSKSSSAKSSKKSEITNPIQYMLTYPKRYIDEYGGIAETPPSSHKKITQLSPYEDKSRFERYMSFEIIIHLQNELDKNLKELKKPNESLFYGLTAENAHNIVGWVGIIPVLNSIGIGDKHAPVGKTASISDANYAIKIACKYVKKIRSTKILKDIEEVFAILEEFLLELFQKEYEKEKPWWKSRDIMDEYNTFKTEAETYLRFLIHKYKDDVDTKILSFITKTCK
jgi:hypothetical protein